MKNLLGYLLGFLLFIAGIPALMWWVSGRPFPWAPAIPWAIIAAVLIVTGLALSIWAIVHMKRIGEGNPFDAYNHEVAPRTKHLMTDGPYRFSRNPMLLGVYIYDIGVIIWLWSLWPLLVFAAEAVLLTLQVRSEEKRLEKDFGEEYLAYKKCVKRYLLFFLLIFITLPVSESCRQQVGQKWSIEKANDWYAHQPWPVGCVYMPSYGGTPVEIWGKEYFKPEVVDYELGLAEDLGFNVIRLFLCDIVWQDDPKGFMERLEKTIQIADKHGMRILMNFFTNGGTIKNPYLGPQPQPVPGIHNSVWMSSPGMEVVNNPDKWPVMERYVKQVIKRYKNDRRILAWCLYNEPENTKGFDTLPFLETVFRWAREVNPSQPLTSPIIALPTWGSYNKDISDFVLANSDIISFHCYNNLSDCVRFHDYCKQFGRPILCSEWMARTRGSDYPSILPFFKENKIGCFSYGLVNGKQQCQYPWNQIVDGERIPFTEEPEVWFHDLFRQDGTPWSEDEIRFIKEMTKSDNQ